MRTPDAQTLAIAGGRGQSTRIRLDMEDASGSYHDITALFNYDFADSATLSESLDQQWQKCDVGIKREVFKLSMSPQMTGSRINALGGGTLLALGRKIKVFVQLCPTGFSPVSARWTLIFWGYLENIDAASDPIQVQCRDLGSLLARTYLTVERDYGVWRPARRYLAGTVVVPSYENPNTPATTRFMIATNTGANWGALWLPSHVYAAGANVIPTRPNGYAYKTTAGGTSGAEEPLWPEPTLPNDAGQTVTDNTVTWFEDTAAATEPAWPAKSSGGSVVDGAITWTEQSLQGTPIETHIQQLLDDNLGASAVVLNTPSSPGYYLRDYRQDKTDVFAACKAIADIIGFDLRYFWVGNESTGSFKLNFQQPTRTSPSVQDTLSPDFFLPVAQLSDDISLYRNIVKIKYYDRTNLDADGNPTAKSVQARSNSSVAALGRLFCEIQEAASSGIDTPTEAQALADLVLADLSNQILNFAVRMPVRWWYQLNDYLAADPDKWVFDTQLSGAVFSIRHSFQANGQDTTEIVLRAKPSSGQERWLRLAAEPNGGVPSNRQVGPRSPMNVSASAVVSGIAVDWHPPLDSKGEYDRTELHVSATNNFTPSDATVVKTVRGQHVEHTTGLIPGTTYYARIVHRDKKGNRGSYSPQLTQAAGHAELITIQPAIRRQVFGFVSADYTSAAGGTGPKYVTNALAGFNLNGYDTAPSPTWDNTLFVWTPDVPGKYAIRASVEVQGATLGDSMIMAMYNNFGAAFVLYSPVATAITDPWGNVRMFCQLIGNIDVSATDVVNTTGFFFEARFGPMPYAGTLTVKAPSLGVNWTTSRGCGSLLEISQVLAPITP